MPLHELGSSYRQLSWRLLEKLFPIYRTIMGDGFKRSLEIIQKIVPLRILKFKSGQKCGSWTIPQEWQVKEASITDGRGKRVVDFAVNPMHLWQYSRAFEGKVSREELRSHIAISEQAPEAIPLGVSFYSRNWGFSVTKKQWEALLDADYTVKIDTSFKNGQLTIGELFLPGQKKEEVLIDAVLSCSSLANNLSGVVAAVCLAKMLSSIKKRRYSYRFLFTPETIGPIAYYYNRKAEVKKIVGGYTLVNLADKNHFHYKKSRPGDTVCDQAMAHSLRFFGEKNSIGEYDVLTGTCGNEKAYNSLGIEIPVGSLRRSPLGSYPEYDTSADNLSFVDAAKLFSSLQVLWGAIQSLERNFLYEHRFEGEPFLTGYGLFPKIKSDIDRIPYDYLMGFTTGRTSLLEIAERASLPVTCFDEPVRLMMEKGLLKRRG